MSIRILKKPKLQSPDMGADDFPSLTVLTKDDKDNTSNVKNWAQVTSQSRPNQGQHTENQANADEKSVEPSKAPKVQSEFSRQIEALRKKPDLTEEEREILRYLNLRAFYYPVSLNCHIEPRGKNEPRE